MNIQSIHNEPGVTIIKNKILIYCVLISIVLFGFLVGWVGVMASPTHGPKIATYPTPQKALVIVDLQEDCTGSTAKAPFPYKNSAELISVVNRLIQKSTDNNLPIVFVDQEFSGMWGTLWSRLFVGGRLLKGAPGSQVDARLHAASFPRFSKPKGDGFSNPKFGEYLIKNHVTEVYIVGVDAEFCVHLTAQGALNRGYSVTAIKDAIGMKNSGKWHEILKRYTSEGINIIESKDL
jgi:nicotinamidase/pyrazinamidase